MAQLKIMMRSYIQLMHTAQDRTLQSNPPLLDETETSAGCPCSLFLTYETIYQGFQSMIMLPCLTSKDGCVLDIDGLKYEENFCIAQLTVKLFLVQMKNMHL
jgi:hypothetical protein